MEENGKRNIMIMRGIIIILLIIIIILVIKCCSCKCEDTPPPQEQIEETEQVTKKYNISILLDLSDRLLENSQIERDTLLISSLENWFYKRQENIQRKEKFRNGDKMKVFFYPQPTIANINEYQKDLSIDMTVSSRGKGKLEEIVANRDRLSKMKDTWHNALNGYYPKKCAKFKSILILQKINVNKKIKTL